MLTPPMWDWKAGAEWEKVSGTLGSKIKGKATGGGREFFA